MRLSALLPFLSLASAKVLVKYDASAGDDPKVLGQLNLQGWERTNWPSGQGMNSSVFIKTTKDPSGIPAAYVHKAAHFTRAEYHSLKGKTEPNKVYYIGYYARFDDVDYSTKIFQWKNYDGDTVGTDNIPVYLAFRKDATGDENHTIQFNAHPDPNDKSAKDATWSKALTMGKAYRFGIVINTSQTNGFVQLYYNGKLATINDPTTGKGTQKFSGNFWPGPNVSSDPKFGLYDGKNFKECNSYIYNIVVGTELSDIAEVAGIQ